MNLHTPGWKIGIAFAILYLVWGSTYYAILISLETLPPFAMTSMRLILAGVLLLAGRRIAGDPLPSWPTVKNHSLAGILTLFGGLGSVSWAEQYLSSSLAAIIVTALPFWFVLFDRQLWGFYFRNKFILAGLLIGFTGVFLLVSHSPHSTNADAVSWVGKLAPFVILSGGICWSLGSLYSKRHSVPGALLVTTGVQFLAAGIFSAIVSVIAGEWKILNLASVSLRSWMAMGYLSIIGSLLTYLAYIWLLGKRPAALVSTYVYVNPVIALLIGAWFASEPITIWQVLALVIIIAGVILVNAPAYLKARR